MNYFADYQHFIQKNNELLLNTMINIAERELKVDIRKKPGAKR